MADVQWIKLYVDMFDKRKIKKIRRLPAGNEILLIWVMLLAIAGKCNAGGMIYITESVPFTEEDLADELGFDVNTIRLATKAFEDLGMISFTKKGFLCIDGWEEHQNTDRLSELREQARQRVAKSREKKRLQQECNVTGNATRNVTVTLRNAIEEEGEGKEKEIKNIEGGFHPPTLAEVEDYVSERGGKIDAKRFHDFYTANGWKKSGGDPILDWRAVVRAWERTEFRKPEESASTGSIDPEEFFAAAVRKSREKIGGG